MAITSDVSTTPKVAQLATAIKLALGELGSGWVEGEIQNLRPAASGHVYFRLADEDAVVNCCIWRSRAARLAAPPKEGTLVQAHYERVDFYGKSGGTALHIDQLRPTGDGELLRRKHEALRRLQEEGLTDPSRRRALPRFPRRIGVIAAHDSDAKVDVIKSLRERFPPAHIVFRPALVEGVRAVDSMIEALIHLQSQHAVDVIVLARGGGGVRELIAFDDLKLCKAIFACDKPVVTSIGHTKQRPNCDHVAAAYADVPARAAELVVPSAAELQAELDRHLTVLGGWDAAMQARMLRLTSLGVKLETATHRFYGERKQTLDRADDALRRARGHAPKPADVIAVAAPLRAAGRQARRQYRDFSEAIARRSAEARKAAGRRLHEASREVRHLTEVVQAKDFRRRGWVLAADARGRPVRSARDRTAGEKLDLRFHDGRAAAVVTDIETEGDGP